MRKCARACLHIERIKKQIGISPFFWDIVSHTLRPSFSMTPACLGKISIQFMKCGLERNREGLLTRNVARPNSAIMSYIRAHTFATLAVPQSWMVILCTSEQQVTISIVL